MSTALNHAADTEYLVRQSMTRGYQLLSLLTPPVYTALVLARRGRGVISVNRLLRATWLGGAVGVAGGGSFEYVRSAYSNEDVVRSRRLQKAYNVLSEFVNSIFYLLDPDPRAIFWRRARVVHLILGGAGIGSTVGIVTHYARILSGDPPHKAELFPVTYDAQPREQK